MSTPAFSSLSITVTSVFVSARTSAAVDPLLAVSGDEDALDRERLDGRRRLLAQGRDPFRFAGGD